MDKEQTTQETLQAASLDEALIQIQAQPKRQYTQQEIDEARDNLALMNDRVFLVTFIDNKNNHIITGLADAVRKIHALPPIPQVQQTTVQNISMLDILGRGMIGDLLGWGESITIALEVQKGKQAGYAVRGTLTSSNAMRLGFNMGSDFTNAPDVIGINILGFRLPQLDHRKEFVSRIVRAEYDSKESFLADKYSDYYIELPKMDDWKKSDLPEAYHDLWDLCCIFKAKINKHEEVIRMQAISNPVALDLSREARKTITPNDFVRSTLSRDDELAELREYGIWLEQRSKAKGEAEGKAKGEAIGKAIGEAKGKAIGEAKGKEEMIIMALQSNTPIEFVDAMRVKAGITDSRFAELQIQAQQAS